MDNREIIPSGKMTKSLIGNFIGWTIIMSIITSILYSLIIMRSDTTSVTTISIFYAISNFIGIFLASLFTVKGSFKKKTIYKIDVASIIMSIIIFFVVIFIIDSLYTYKQVHSEYDKYISEDYTISFYDSYVDKYGTAEQKSEYNEQKEKLIQEAKKDINTILIVNALTTLAMYALMVPYIKNSILKYSIDDDNINDTPISDNTEL